MSILRDVFRRRLRSVLTISGVAVGVFALVVLGAMAEKANLTLERNADYHSRKIVVVEKKAGDGFMYGIGNRPLSYAKIAELEAYPGVLDVAPQVVLTLDQQALPIGTPSSVLGGYLGTKEHPEPLRAADGRMLADDETGVAVVGPDLVGRLDAEVGGTVNVRGEDFEVVGIAERSNTMLDQSVIVPLRDSQRLLAKTLPPAFAKSVEATALIAQATVYAEPGVDANELGTRLERDVTGIHAIGPAVLAKQFGQNLALYAGLLVSVASVALIVGCLSLVNTMMMSLSERKREVGLKRALGASRRRIAADVFAESVVVGVLGGVLGLAAGFLVAGTADAAAALGSGSSVFLVTGRLVAGALVFSAVLGGVAGLYPALRASRSDPAALLAAR